MEEAPDGLRRARWWAIAAFLLLVTGAWLPWWSITIAGAGFESVTTQRLWGIGDTGGEASAAWVWVTSSLVAASALWIFVRVAGRSWLYEPASWSRDLRLQAATLVLALASAWLWPHRVPFWGDRHYGNTTVGLADAAFRPGLGWTVVLLAAVLLIVAWAVGRRDVDMASRDPANG